MRLNVAGQRIETWKTGRFLEILGFMLVAIGGFIAYMLLSGSAGVTVGDRPGRPGDAWFPLLIAAVGMALAGFRAHAEIDVGSRTRTRYWRFWWNVRSTREPLGEPLHVTLRVERRGSGKDSRTVYAVGLVTSEDSFAIAAPGNEHRGRQHAEGVARMCGIPLHDMRGGTTLVREAADLDRSVLDLETPLAVEAPTQCRVGTARDHTGSVLQIPSPAGRLLPLFFIPALLPLGFFTFVWWPGLRETLGVPSDSIVRLVFTLAPLLLGLLPGAVLVLVAYRGGFLPRKIVVRRGTLYVGRQSFPATELEELHVTGAAGFLTTHLRAASDTHTARMGRGLTRAELDYARAAILDALRNSR